MSTSGYAGWPPRCRSSRGPKRVAERPSTAFCERPSELSDASRAIARAASDELCVASGGAAGSRTPDLFDANEARYQLRYSPECPPRIPGRWFRDVSVVDGPAVLEDAVELAHLGGRLHRDSGLDRRGRLLRHLWLGLRLGLRLGLCLRLRLRRRRVGPALRRLGL